MITLSEALWKQQKILVHQRESSCIYVIRFHRACVGSLLLGSLLVASSFSTQAAEEMLRKAVGKSFRNGL